MSELENFKTLNRRKFLKKMVLFSGLAVTVTACGDVATSTSAPAPTATIASPSTPSGVTVAPSAIPSRATSTPPAIPTKKAGAVTSTPAASKNDRNFVEVGALTDFQGVDTEPKLVNLPNAKKPNAVFIVRQGGKYEALSNICTHQGCEVDWSSADQLFECPCHGSQYDINGDNVGGPAPLPLASFAVKVENGRLLVSTKRNN